MKPCSELNPRVWQGDCLLGIDQKRSEMFQNFGAGGPVLGTDNVHHPDNTARHALPTPPRFPAGANWVQGGRAIALTNGGGPKLFPTAKRFSSLKRGRRRECPTIHAELDPPLTRALCSGQFHKADDLRRPSIPDIAA